MVTSVYDNIKQMWFGTREKMGWIELPQTGADVSPARRTSGETLIVGGAFQRNSFDAHKTYQFVWPDSSSRQLASTLQGYANGTYGRGLLYFLDPMYYETNLLPRRIADPSMALDYEAPSLVSGVLPRSTPTPANSNNLPVQTAVYDLPANYRASDADYTWIPIPEGMTLLLGAFYTSSGNATAGWVVKSGSTKTLLPKVSLSASTIITNFFPHDPAIGGVSLGIDVVTPGASAVVSPVAAVARFIRNGDIASLDPSILSGPWMSGEGHSGARFSGNGGPTLVNYSGIDGGQVGMSASFVEVGAWA